MLSSGCVCVCDRTERGEFGGKAVRGAPGDVEQDFVGNNSWKAKTVGISATNSKQADLKVE